MDLSAQDSTLVTIKPGNKVSDVLPQAEIYYYPEFTNGKVVLKDGKIVGAKMNYNRVFDQMLFLGQKEDTFALSVEKEINFIAIGEDRFYYNQGFIRIIVDNDFVKLAEKQTWTVADIRKIGLLGSPKTTVAIQSLTQYTNGLDAAKSKDLVLNEEIVLRKETEYYFGNVDHHFVRASKKKLLDLFPKDEVSIENYLKQNKVDFDKKEDLEKLAQFISQLY
jgi:hypothetical protein